MVNLLTKVLVFDSGERYPLLVDGKGMPDFYISLFITVVMRPKSQASTLEKVLSALKHLRRWEIFNGRVLADEFYDGHLLEQEDLYSLRDHCKLDSEAFESWVVQVNKIKASSLINVASLNRYKTPQVLTVSSNHRAIRLGYVAQYLKFLAETVMRKRPDFVTMKPYIDRMVDGLRQMTPRTRSYLQNSGAYRTPKKSVFESYLSVSKPGSVDNPFRNSARQLRHYIIMRLQYEAGLRSGEVLGLWLEDIEYGIENNVHVIRRHHDPRDPRSKQLVAKTEPRVIPIGDELARLIHQYVIEVRSKISEAQSHPLLFVTHASNGKGRPISSKAVMQEMGLVISTRPDTFSGLTRHQFRHGFTLKVKDDLTKQGIPNADQTAIVQYLLGHKNPKSQDDYTQVHNQKLAKKTLREINQKRHDNAKKTDSGNNT
ncbi:tyrosine-type recombinase/integrase [Vreelandella piezotolerans]|uniref:Site-specific integrase n=1 Tax=Vreelandella piezotolerans TaxID=2609667 RepID=A0ABQ6XBF3_9GAMM|nr:site-specific integrase [Halomonas piezotolerans]KAE8438440.1 site-specific integrase [Halomonas piezotolerans]QJA22875.1 site-specific integrase [Halomonas piezotolerans]